MPQPWIISILWLSQYQRISDTGGAEPPQVSRPTVEMSYLPGLASSAALTPCQIVGTPAEIVTFSSCISRRKESGIMKRCGITCLAPTIEAQNGSPQPMAWNIGTMPSEESRAEKPMESVRHSVRVCR